MATDLWPATDFWPTLDTWGASSSTSLTVVEREAGWLSAQPGVTSTCGPVLPYARRQTGSYNRRVTLRRSKTDITQHDLGHDMREHTLTLLIDWPGSGDLVQAQTVLDQAADLLSSLLLRADRTHGGLWADSADSGDTSPDLTVTFTDPDDPVALAGDGRLQATVSYTVVEITPRG